MKIKWEKLSALLKKWLTIWQVSRYPDFNLTGCPKKISWLPKTTVPNQFSLTPPYRDIWHRCRFSATQIWIHGLKIAIKLYSPPSPPPLGGHSLARPQTLRPTPGNMLENGLTQFMQFRQQQQQAAAAAAAQADLMARLGRPIPRLPLPLPLPFLHAHMAAASAKFGASNPVSPSSPFADNLRARFHGFAAAAASANSAANNVSNSSPLSLPPPPPSVLHQNLIPRTSPNNISEGPNNSPLTLGVGPTSPSCRNPYDDQPMSPNGMSK